MIFIYKCVKIILLIPTMMILKQTFEKKPDFYDDLLSNWWDQLILRLIWYKFKPCTSVCLLDFYIFVAKVTNLNISAKWGRIFMKPSAYVKIGLLRWLLFFMGMHICACMHSACKHACNLRQESNLHISSKWSKILYKLGIFFKELSRMH